LYREKEQGREKERERERKKEKLHYQLVNTPKISAASINPRLKALGLKSASLSFIVERERARQTKERQCSPDIRRINQPETRRFRPQKR
jgi:hypothetical protein